MIRTLSKRRVSTPPQGEPSPNIDEPIQEQMAALHKVIQELRAEVRELADQKEIGQANQQATEQELYALMQTAKGFTEADDEEPPEDDDAQQNPDMGWGHVQKCDDEIWELGEQAEKNIE